MSEFDEKIELLKDFKNECLIKEKVKVIDEIIFVLEQKEKLLRHLDVVDKIEKNVICKSLFGSLIGTDKVREFFETKRELK